MGEWFSFKGEIGRGRLWLIYISINVTCFAIGLGCFIASRYISESAFNIEGPSAWPQTPAGWILAFLYWATILPLLWIFIAAFVKRLRDVGIALKWLAIFVPVFALYGAAFAIFIPEGTTRASTLGIVVVVITGLPACLMMLWLFGSAFLAPGHKPRRVEPAQLPDGWKA